MHVQSRATYLSSCTASVGGFNNAPYILETGPSQEPQMKKSRTMGKHAVANAAKRAKGNTAASDADSAPTKKRKNKNTANNALGVQQGAIQKPTRGQRRKLAKSRRAAA